MERFQPMVFSWWFIDPPGCIIINVSQVKEVTDDEG
jgi:hypothetical protein